MARLTYWSGVPFALEILGSPLDQAPRTYGRDPLSDFYINHPAYSQREFDTDHRMDHNHGISDPVAILGVPQVYTRCYVRFYERPSAEAYLAYVSWIGLTHDVMWVTVQTDGSIKFSSYGSGSMTLAYQTGVLDLNTWYRLEWRWSLAAANLTVEAKLDGVALGAARTTSFGGTPTWFSRSTYWMDNATTLNMDLADVCMDDSEWVGDTKVSVLPITGVGTYDEWTVNAGRDYRGLLENPIFASPSNSFKFTTATTGKMVTFALPTPAAYGYTDGTLRQLKVYWYLTAGSNPDLIIRRNGVDTFYPLSASTTVSTYSIDISGWALTDTIEIGLRSTASATISLAMIGAYIEVEASTAPAAPTDNMHLIVGTYAGTGTPQTIDFGDVSVADLLPDYVSIVRTDSAGTTAWWWDGRYSTRKSIATDDSENFFTPILGGFILSNNTASVNTSGGTYSYVAFFDPGQRGSERAMACYLQGSDDVDHPMLNTDFLPEALFIEDERDGTAVGYQSPYFRGPGMVGDETADLNSVAANFVPDVVQSMALGTFQLGAFGTSDQPGMAYAAFRTTEFNTARLFDTNTYVGDGTGQRVITCNLNGATPVMVVEGHTAARARNLWQGGIDKHVGTGVIDAVAIIAVGPNTFTVHSNLNQNGITYSWFVFALGTDYTMCEYGVIGVSPDHGAAAGGTAVTVTGLHFESGGVFSFGGVAPTSVVIVNSTTATMVTPAGAGFAVVTYTSPIGVTSTCLYGGYTYDETVPENPTSSPPFQQRAQWALQRFDFQPRVEGDSGMKGES